MKMRAVFPIIISVLCCGHAFADCGTNQSYLNISQVNSILPAHFACGQSTSIDPPGWNELHMSSGILQEQHTGGSTVQNVGTWSTANASGRGRVTYLYSGGPTDTYEIAVRTGNCSGGCTTLPQTYAFCGVSAGAPPRLLISVSPSFQALSGCPSNP